MALRLRVIAANPLAATFLVRILSADRELSCLLSATPIANLNSLPQHGPPCLFVVDTFSLPLELSELTRLLRVRCPGSKFLALVPPDSGDDENILRLLHTASKGLQSYPATQRKSFRSQCGRCCLGASGLHAACWQNITDRLSSC